jgi:hypothetical protein
MIEEIPNYEIHEFRPRSTKYCFCVVTLNEGDRLTHQLQRMKPLASLADIVVCDGRSKDGSTDPDSLKQMGVRTLLNTDERGLGTAIRMALAYAMKENYEGIITVDGNGKDGVESLPRFMEGLDQGWDLVQGSRFIKGATHKNTPWDRYIGIRFMMAPAMALGSGFWYTDPTNGFRAMSMKFLKDPRVQPLRNIFVGFNMQDYFIYRAAKLGFRVKEIPVDRRYPDDGSVPTKIHGLKAKILDLWAMVSTALGRYNPKS